MASILPKTLNVTVAVKRLPKVWDPVLRYQTPNGPSTGRLKLVVSSLRSLLLGSTNGVKENAIVLTERVGEYPVISTVIADAVLAESWTEVIRGTDGRTNMLVAGAAVVVRLMAPASVTEVAVNVIVPATVPV